jgi:hypothetical protein
VTTSIRKQPLKKDLTKVFLEQSNVDATPEAIKLFSTWWFTPHSPIGLRLSSEGHKYLTTILKLSCYTIKIQENTVKSFKLFLLMSKYLNYPYYLKGNDTIVVFGEEDGIMLALMSGDITSYLNNLAS